MDRLRLYLRTLPHLKPWQIAGRLVARIRRPLTYRFLPDPPPTVDGGVTPHVPFPHHDPWNSRDAILNGRFTFLSETCDLGDPIDWNGTAHLPLLWQFNLHYFQYLHLLRPDERESICGSWAEAHTSASGAAWHPYTTSLRIVNWCRAGLESSDLKRSLYRQAAFLFRNLETYVYGNHLLENARALVYAGQFFGDLGEAPEWTDRGLQIFRTELKAQILPDGGHFERSPMYQALMLEGVLDVVNILPNGHPDLDQFKVTAQRMLSALQAMTHPDGEIALLNDATREIALSTGQLTDYYSRLCTPAPDRITELPETGYYVYRDRDVYLIVDGGAGGPDHLMAHAHADMFTYELSLGGVKFVVDTGVYEYAAGPMRDHVRSTAAHNTVTVDNLNQIECWDSFRVARRSKPQDVRVATDNGQWRFSGRLAGYGGQANAAAEHIRELSVDEVHRSILVTDTISGNGRHTITSRIHLHPDVNLYEHSDFDLERDGTSARLEIRSGTASTDQGWYCPEFGVRNRCPVIRIDSIGELPVELSYAIHF